MKLISIGQLLDQTWDTYRANFKSLMKITSWFFLLPFLSMVIILGMPMPTDFSSVPVFTNTTLLLALFSILTLAFTIILGSWILLNVIGFTNDPKKDLKTLYHESASKLLGYFWIALLKILVIAAPFLLLVPAYILIFIGAAAIKSTAISALGIVLLIVGFIAAFVYAIKFATEFYFPEYGLAIDNRRGKQALIESKQMVKGRFWAVFIRLYLPKLVFMIPILIVSLIIVAVSTSIIQSLVTDSLPATLRATQIASEFINAGIAMLFTPLIIVADTILYKNLK